jgi:hypothetical protein
VRHCAAPDFGRNCVRLKFEKLVRIKKGQYSKRPSLKPGWRCCRQ